MDEGSSMSREIKFKIWCFYEKKMLSGVDLHNAFNYQTDNRVIVGTFGSDRIAIQYTGLKDKNGVEIYEGDRLVFARFDHLNGPWQGVVKWYGTGWHVFLNWNSEQPSIREWSSPCAVIGNIYENPELLETK